MTYQVAQIDDRTFHAVIDHPRAGYLQGIGDTELEAIANALADFEDCEATGACPVMWRPQQ